MPKVLVIIPAFNEEETIAKVVEEILAHQPAYHVLVVDDGSSDQTAALVRQQDRATLIRLPFNSGIGVTMQTGFKYALRNGYDIAVQCDADGQHPPEQMHRLVDRVASGDADMMIGSRYVAQTDYAPSFTRRLGKSILSRLIDSLIGGGITDTTSGFRAMNRSVLQIVSERYPDDYPEPEILVTLHRHRLRVAETPVDMRPRQGGESSINPNRAAYYMVKVALAIFVDFLRNVVPSKGES